MNKLPFLVISIAFLAGCQTAPKVVKATPPPARASKLSPDQLISAYKRQVANDPQGAIGWSQLSLAYLSRSRAYDSYDDARRAEESARKSLEVRRRGNVMAAVRLTQSLLNQHRFQDALASSADAMKIASYSPPAQFSRMECLIETGRYEEAKALFVKVGNNLSERDRLLIRSRMYEIYGQPDRAIELVSRLLIKDSSAPESRAFLYTRLADLFWSIRDLEQAEKNYSQALELAPKTWKAMLGSVRVAHARKDWQRVVKLGHETEELVHMTDLVSLMGDAYFAMWDQAMAKEHFGEAAQLAGYPLGEETHSHGDGKPHSHTKKHGHPLDRQYARFAADHRLNLDNALKAAREDMKQRQDIIGWDTLAWVHYQRGEVAEARKAMNKAMQTGSKDVALVRHAELIFGDAEVP
ncbi:MAG: tetratricopeptide repeat protein [Fimbriimonas sp.]